MHACVQCFAAKLSATGGMAGAAFDEAVLHNVFFAKCGAIKSVRVLVCTGKVQTLRTVLAAGTWVTLSKLRC
jgi:hypothetical protein